MPPPIVLLGACLLWPAAVVADGVASFKLANDILVARDSDGHYTRRRFSLHLSMVARTPRFEQQNDSDHFGVLTLSSWL